jgi:RNA polymerase sigma-70 factor (ECF subfamily)
MCRLQRELISDRSAPDSSQTTPMDRLGRMFSDHHDFVLRYVQRFGLSVDHADDAAAEAFLVAAERLDDIKLGSERAFLFGTALRVAQKLRRTERRWVPDGDMDDRFGRSATPETLAAERRAVELASDVVSTMDLGARSAFVLFEFDGRTARQIAEEAGVPLGTVASRLRRARHALKEALTAGAQKASRHRA